MRVAFRIVAAVVGLATTMSVQAHSQDWIASPANVLNVPVEGPRADNGLPDGRIAIAKTGDVSRAWYILPTSRYRHGILGDAIEAGGIKILDRHGKQFRLKLPPNLVFEDRTPRLHDLDGDGKTEIITILSSQSHGASIAVYGLSGGSLKMLFRTPFIGRANRWRNVAGIGDYNGDGHLDIAEVVTPHIGGTLKFWSWNDKELSLLGSKKYFSNHAIGSREQRLSTTADFNGDGRVDIAVPGARRRILYLIGFTSSGSGSSIGEISSIRLPAAISQPVVSTVDRGQTTITVGLADGSVWHIRAR